MSEEESFVILGTSPTPSMETYTSINNSNIQEISNRRAIEEKIWTKVDDPPASSSAISYPDFSDYFHASRENTPTPTEGKNVFLTETDGVPYNNEIVSAALSEDLRKMLLGNEKSEADRQKEMQKNSMVTTSFATMESTTHESVLVENQKEMQKKAMATSFSTMESLAPESVAAEKQKEMKKNAMVNSFATMGSSTHESVAAEFLLGEVSNDVLKSNIFTQFPSLCSSNTSAEDIMKLQNLMCEYVEMKDNLQRTNSMMRQHFSVLKKWQQENEQFKIGQTEEMHSHIHTVAKLMNENNDLKRELDLKTEQLKITEQTLREENDNLIQSNSEKLSIINNLSKQIEKFEKDKLKSYEYVPRNDEKEDENAAGPSKEAIKKAALNEVIHGNQPSYSELIAMNLDYQDMKERYIEEIDCLKVNLVAAEEVIKQQQADIIFLKSQDIDKSGRFDNLQQEIQLLKAQLDVYSKDFEMERSARQEEASKNEQLLSDLTMLQRRNQELLEQNDARRSRGPRPSPPEVGVPAREEQIYNRTNFVCPLCAKAFRELSTLHVHVQECLDK